MNNNSRKRVGILGGSFDPVHNGHIGLATQVRDHFQLDRVLFIPAYISPHKLDSKPASPHHRLAMLQRAIEPHPLFSISDIELSRKDVSFTIDTLSALTDQQPDTDFFLIIGNDAFRGIKTWKSVHRLFEMCHVIVATRPGFPLKGIEKNILDIFENDYSPETESEGVRVFHHRNKITTLNFFDLSPMNVSSSVIREKISNRQATKNMLPPEVENYIIENQLYSINTHS